MRSILLRVSALGLPLAAVGWLSLSPAPAVEPRGEAPQPEVVAWERLASEPARHLGRSVRVVVLFAGEVGQWNAYVTRFGQGGWRAFEAWSDAQEPWNPADHAAPAVRVWARRGGGAAWAMAQARPGARLELRLRVHELFLGSPWCEVEAVVPCVEEVGEGTLIHASRGVVEQRDGRHELALLAFDEALKAPLPGRVRGALEALRARSARPAPERR